MADDSTVRIKLTVSTNKVGSESSNVIEMDAGDWNEMDDAGRNEALLEQVLLMNLWSWDWSCRPVPRTTTPKHFFTMRGIE